MDENRRIAFKFGKVMAIITTAVILLTVIFPKFGSVLKEMKGVYIPPQSRNPLGPAAGYLPRGIQR